jgi:proteic killer suppression protein
MAALRARFRLTMSATVFWLRRLETGWNRCMAIARDGTVIRINDQWRICCLWTEAGPENVEIVEYHRG